MSVAARPDAAGAQPDLPPVLLPYQARAVAMLEGPDAPVVVIEKSRRIGLTWALAAFGVLRAGRRKAAGGSDVMYISFSREMTREFVDACAMWARAFGVAAGEAEETLFDGGDGDRAIAAFRISFASGFEVMALSSAPRGLRGKQGFVIIDEAAFVENLDELLKAALALRMWGGGVAVVSTHDGADNPFNQLVQDILAGRSKFGHMRVDLDDALRDGLYRRICLTAGRTWSSAAEAEWRASIIDFYGEGAEEELFCVPSRSSGAWLPAPLIEARMTQDVPVLRLELPGDYMFMPEDGQKRLLDPFLAALRAQLEDLDLAPTFAFGSDFARHADLTASSLLAIGPRLERREVLAYELRNVPGHEQKLVARMVLSHVRQRLVGAAFDATGMGWTVAEDLGRLYGLREDPEGSGMVMAVKFTEEWYRLHMPPLKAALEDAMLELIRDDDHLSDLRSVKVVRGIARVPPLREGEKGRRRHGDHAIALALAHYASRQRWSEYGYRPVGRAAGDGFSAHPDDRPERSWWRPPLGPSFGRL